MRVFVSSGPEIVLPDGHPFPVTKYARLESRIRTEAGPLGITITAAPPADDEDLLRVHGREYLEHVSRGTLPDRAMRRIGLPWSPQLVARACASVGATCAAAEAAFVDGVAATLGGGTHHAAADAGSGYCVFNDVVVAIRRLQATDPGLRVIVIDADVHQGDGTAALTADDRRVFTYSIHGAKNFPARKVPGSVDIALPDGTDDATYLRALIESLDPALDDARADLAFYLAGADPFHRDRWGRFALTKKGLARRDRFVLEACRRRGLPTTITMAGGYAPRIDDIVDIHAATIRIAVDLSRHWVAPDKQRHTPGGTASDSG
jgi:acetoin utilization deacetylase AcuC-like enzyme